MHDELGGPFVGDTFNPDFATEISQIYYKPPRRRRNAAIFDL